MKKLSFVLTLALGAISAYAVEASSMTDSRDGQTYRMVKIGDQTWMAENLNYKVNDGKQSWCYDIETASLDYIGKNDAFSVRCVRNN